MIRGLKIICFVAAVLILSSCLSPSVISIDTNRGEDSQSQESTATTAPEPTSEPEPTPTEGIVDCGSDLDCFFDAVESCQESSLVFSQGLNMMGAEISTSLHLTVLGPLEEQCEFAVKTDQVKISFSEEAVQQLLESGKSEEEIEAQRLVMEESQSAAGYDEVCSGNPEDIIQVLQRWEEGQFSMTDWDPFTCQGKIFSSADPAPEPTEAPSPTAEAQPAAGGNFLTNMSFEVNPETTQPGWYIDAKNTDVVAKWTTDQAKLGQYSLLVSATESANKGYPGWFLVDPIPVEEAVWHVIQVWAMTPDGADAFVSAEFLDENGVTITTQGIGCVDLESNTWNKVGFGISEARLDGVSFIRLGLQQCLLETEGTLTHLYYDEIYIGTTPP